MDFLKKHFSNIFFVLLLIILFANPFGLGMKVKSSLIKLLSFSPSEISIEERVKLKSYNWKLKTSDNKIIDFSDFKGEVIFVNFWATWCPPCVAEMPSIENLYKDYGDKIKFVIVANDERQKVEDFIKNKNFTMPIYYGFSKELAEFSSNSIPISFLINKDGEIVSSKKGAANWNSKATREMIDKLL